MKFSSVALVDNVEDDKSNDAGIFLHEIFKDFLLSHLILDLVRCLLPVSFLFALSFNMYHEFAWILQFILYF